MLVHGFDRWPERRFPPQVHLRGGRCHLLPSRPISWDQETLRRHPPARRSHPLPEAKRMTMPRAGAILVWIAIAAAATVTVGARSAFAGEALPGWAREAM